ncbi:MAG: UDP-N-acetylmuramoyl-tripeptide--D-alanyl-D-alanine ligase [Chitinophagales bacterium]|nr:UDP-N-acetylmuramoyl-tripeptide--D-alanyl-D-alanine ligase [Chitinophagales bacterium]
MEIQDLYFRWKQSTGIATDSRKVEPSQIFFALKGDTFDGNAYAMAALDQGASLVVVDDPSLAHEQDSRIVIVEDVLTTLQLLARHHRDQLNIPILAITGSNGKTTTKELTRDVLLSKYRILATRGNLNNHIGVPLTVLSITDEIELAIIEMGANHQGEIDLLCKVTNPDYGMITNIGKAHLDGFGGMEGIKKGKSELYRYLSAHGGTIFLNEEDETLKSLVPVGCAVVPYCPSDILQVRDDHDMISYESNGCLYQTQLYGAYNINNIAFAVAAGRYFNVPEDQIHLAITSYKPGNNRSQLFKYQSNHIILDAYNANPSSMKASIESFVKMGGEQVIVLGDMFELGTYAKEEHAAVLDLIDNYVFVDKIFIGAAFLSVSQGHSGHFFKDIDTAKAYFRNCHFHNKNILLKGSRGIAVERILE